MNNYGKTNNYDSDFRKPKTNDNDTQKTKTEELKSFLTLPQNDKLGENNYADLAQNCFKYFDKAKDDEKLSSSKLRSMYSMLCDIMTNESASDSSELSEKCLSALRNMRVHFIYDIGRDQKAVKRFFQESRLLGYLSYVEKTKKRSDFDIFCKYFESLVAFHRFYNPR